MHALGRAGHLRDLFGQRVERGVEIAAQAFEFGRKLASDPAGQVALLQRGQSRGQFAGHMRLRGHLRLGRLARPGRDTGADPIQRTGDIAQFIAVVGAGNHDIEIARRHRRHRIAQPAQRPGHPQAEHQHDCQPGGKANSAQQQDRQERPITGLADGGDVPRRILAVVVEIALKRLAGHARLGQHIAFELRDRIGALAGHQRVTR